MAEEHWFDALHRALVGGASRRDALRLSGAVALALVFGAEPAAGKQGGKKHRKKKGKSKPKPSSNPNSGARCGQDECSARFGSLEAIDACQLKCGRCRVREKFCVVGADAEHPDTHATCCYEHQDCCNGACIDVESDSENCGGCGIVCAAGDLCIGYTCVPSAPPPSPCPTGQTRCSGDCVDLLTHIGNCGACGIACPVTVGGRQHCESGACVCTDAGWWKDPVCGCTPPGYTCCNSHSWCPSTHTCRAGGSGCDAIP